MSGYEEMGVILGKVLKLMAAAFERAAQELKAAGAAGRVAASDAQKLQLYALFKQSTAGDCGAAAPSAFRVVERAKWSSWSELRGTPPEEAKRRYVQLVQTLLPSVQAAEDAAPQPKQQQKKKQKSMQKPTAPMQGQRPRQQAAGGRASSVLLQLTSWLAVAGAALLFGVEVALPMTRRAAYTLPDEVAQYEELGQKLSPLLWFAVGYAAVVLLRSRSFPWPKGLWVSTVAPVARSRGRRRRRRALAESELDVFLREHGIKVVRQAEAGNTVPRLALSLPEDADAFQFGDCSATIPYTVEQTADVYYRKFKEPLPDPASRLLDSIELVEERQLDEYCAVFKRRVLRFRNEAPSLIKRFASSDFVEYIEDSLLDKQNRLFYVYVKNESFQSLGALEDFSVYKAHSDKPYWTDLHQFCRVHITSSSLSFFRSRLETFISNFYCKNAPDARSYHLQRITEEFGDPAE
ncbi:Acyl-CoA-binding protein 3 [Phytophthora cinnamomi]|uniref:Acyl-CoA-binding protein 3 n=1 Tax=Phytophthora cinnamomi TaxID=4785 RepID=UPI0035596655|nr:Acyl-CoA-binding protein 3 [Phytophthora cinnamomi]